MDQIGLIDWIPVTQMWMIGSQLVWIDWVIDQIDQLVDCSDRQFPDGVQIVGVGCAGRCSVGRWCSLGVGGVDVDDGVDCCWFQLQFGLIS